MKKVKKTSAEDLGALAEDENHEPHCLQRGVGGPDLAEALQIEVDFACDEAWPDLQNTSVLWVANKDTDDLTIIVKSLFIINDLKIFASS